MSPKSTLLNSSTSPSTANLRSPITNCKRRNQTFINQQIISELVNKTVDANVVAEFHELVTVREVRRQVVGEELRQRLSKDDMIR